MRAINIVLMSVLLVLAACQPQPLFPGNETNASFEINETLPDNVTDVDENVDETVDEVEEDIEETDEEDLQEPADDEYAAVITATEGETVELQTRAEDPDGDDVNITYGDPFDENGVWNTDVGDADEYEVAVTATDGKATTEATILVVIQAANQAPVIEGPQTLTVEEGETVDLGVFTITDPDGDEIITSYAGWMQASEYTTDFDDQGEHTVRVIAEDTEGNVAEQTVTVIVENVNRAPSLEIEERRITATEGETVEIQAIGDDPDGDDVTIRYEEPFDEDGTWQTSEGDAGDYRVEVTASDGDLEESRTVFVTIEPANRPPVIEIDATITVQEGDTVDLEDLVDIEDPEGEDVEVTYSGWMTSSTYETDFDDAGEHEVTITATDGTHTVTETVTIVVEDVNRPPVFVRPA